MKRLLFALALLLLLAGCGQVKSGQAESEQGESERGESIMTSEALPPAEPVVLEDEVLSPDGRFYARAVGTREGVSSGGPYAADSIQITDAETGEVLWEDFGAYEQSILWSPEGGLAALARTARTWCSITVIETENWTSWDFTLPDGSSIPEYTFLPDDEPWGVWQSEGGLLLTIGQGGERGDQCRYCCTIKDGEEGVTGYINSWQRREPFQGVYDFDHNGEPEIVELVTDYEREALDQSGWQTGWYEIRVRTKDYRLYWGRSLHESHPGWGAYFACRVDGEDYLLRYLPTMYQGFATYEYEIFSLNESGEEQIAREGSVSFDINFGSPMHEKFDPEEIAAFLEEVHGLLKDSELLLTTEGGEFRSGGPGADFKDDLAYWTDDPLYDNGKSLGENIRDMGAYWEKMMTA